MDIEEAMNTNILIYWESATDRKTSSSTCIFSPETPCCGHRRENFHRRLSNKTASAEKELRTDNVE